MQNASPSQVEEDYCNKHVGSHCHLFLFGYILWKCGSIVVSFQSGTNVTIPQMCHSSRTFNPGSFLRQDGLIRVMFWIVWVFMVGKSLVHRSQVQKNNSVDKEYSYPLRKKVLLVTPDHCEREKHVCFILTSIESVSTWVDQRNRWTCIVE